MKLHTYQSVAGRDLIAEYIDTLTKEEQIDAFSVLKCMEEEEFDKIQSIFITCMQKAKESNRKEG